MLAIYKREMRSYFTSPVGYMFYAIFFAVSAFLFMTYTVQAGENSSFPSYFSVLLFLFIVHHSTYHHETCQRRTENENGSAHYDGARYACRIVIGKYLAAFTIFGSAFLLSSIVYYIPLAL